MQLPEGLEDSPFTANIAILTILTVKIVLFKLTSKSIWFVQTSSITQNTQHPQFSFV